MIWVYGFVIMPNQLQIIWDMFARSGKEMPHASFNKATGQLILRDLKNNNPSFLKSFEENEGARQ